MGRRHTVLVVEDEGGVRLNTTLYLQDCGYEVLQAADSSQAIRLILSHPEIDLVFADVKIPGAMDGVVLARWLAEHRSHIPVMLATGDESRVSAMRELCGDKAFVKPYPLSGLVAAMGELLNARKSSH
jgi:DNA-binding response OmpR family regulator